MVASFRRFRTAAAFTTLMASSERIVAVESTDKLTDPQIAAKVKEHYGIVR